MQAGGVGALGFSGATEDTIRTITSEEFLEKRLSNPDVAIYVVKERGKVLGFASTRKIDRFGIELSGIAVLESSTGRGIGTRLVEKVLAAAYKSGVRRIVVKTETANNRAISFYKKFGFSDVGTAQEHVEGTIVDVKILEMTLNRS